MNWWQYRMQLAEVRTKNEMWDDCSVRSPHSSEETLLNWADLSWADQRKRWSRVAVWHSIVNCIVIENQLSNFTIFSLIDCVTLVLTFEEHILRPVCTRFQSLKLWTHSWSVGSLHSGIDSHLLSVSSTFHSVWLALSTSLKRQILRLSQTLIAH